MIFMPEPIEPYCDLYGKSLDVLKLEKQLDSTLERKTILGQLAKRGRYKGKPNPYGACQVVVPKDVILDKRIEWLADCIAVNIDIFRKCGADDIIFWIVFRGVQGGMELSVREIQK